MSRIDGVYPICRKVKSGDPKLQLHINKSEEVLNITDEKTGEYKKFYGHTYNPSDASNETIHVDNGRYWHGEDAKEFRRLLGQEYSTKDIKKRINLINRMHSAELYIYEQNVVNNTDYNVSSKYPLISVHIPKTAGQSVNNILNIKHKGHRALQQLQTKLNPDIYNSYTKFGIVRNPFDRIVSLYSHRIKYDHRWDVYGFKDTWDTISKTYLTKNYNKSEISYSDELKPVHITDTSLRGSLTTNTLFEWWFWNFDVHQHMLVDPHLQFMSCYDCLCDNAGELGVDYTLRFEHLNEDWENMFEVLNLKAPKLPKINKTKHKHYSEYFECETGELIKDFIYKRFNSDFKFFGYSFD